MRLTPVKLFPMAIGVALIVLGLVPSHVLIVVGIGVLGVAIALAVTGNRWGLVAFIQPGLNARSVRRQLGLTLMLLGMYVAAYGIATLSLWNFFFGGLIGFASYMLIRSARLRQVQHRPRRTVVIPDE